MTEETLRQFIGPRSKAYIRYWRIHKNKDGILTGYRPSFSLWPLLSLSLWFWYRKLWGWAIGVAVMANLIVLIALFTENDLIAGLLPLVTIAIVLVLCIWSPAFYLHHVQRVISRLDRQNLGSAAFTAALNRQGGVTIRGASLGVLAIAAITVVTWGGLLLLTMIVWVVCSSDIC